MDLFSFIREHVDILDLIGQYVSLKQYGTYWKGLSPFKGEKTASFTVTPSKRIFYCFSTNCGGDVIDFISRVERCSQFEAAKILIEKYKLNIPKECLSSLSYDKDSADKKTFYFKICSFFSRYCQNELKKNSEAFDYLTNRKILIESINNFEIGYCPSSAEIEKFIAEAKKENILISDLINAGIINEGAKYFSESYLNNEIKRKHFFVFEDRIIFPIKNLMGMICAFGARIYKINDTRAKYINTQTTDEFSKKESLYNISNAKKVLDSEKILYLVEGYFDVISMHQAGYKNTVASMGTAFTESHVKVIEKNVRELVVLYDGDEAGRNAIKRLIAICWGSLINVKIVELPRGKDPDLLSRENKINEFIEKALLAEDYLININIKDYINSSLAQKEEALKDIVLCLQNIKDEMKRAILISEISLKLNIERKFIENLINKNKKKEEKFLTNEKNNENKKLTNENNIVLKWYIMTAYSIIFYFEDKDTAKKSQLLIKEFAPNKCKIIVSFFDDYINNLKESFDYIAFFNTLDSELNGIMLKLISKYNFSSDQFKIIYKVILKNTLQERK